MSYIYEYDQTVYNMFAIYIYKYTILYYTIGTRNSLVYPRWVALVYSHHNCACINTYVEKTISISNPFNTLFAAIEAISACWPFRPEHFIFLKHIFLMILGHKSYLISLRISRWHLFSSVFMIICYIPRYNRYCFWRVK